VLSTGALLFWVLSAVVVLSALAVVLLKNIVHSALYLVLSFIGVAGIYVLLNAEFLAAVQVLVYAGAIAVLIVFAVMLTRRGDIRFSNLFNVNYLAAGVVSLTLFIIILITTLRTRWITSNAGLSVNNVEAIADAFLVRYVVPFEITAVLLLVAIVGAIFLARGVKEDR